VKIIAVARKELKEALLKGGVDEVFTAKDGLEAYSILKELHENESADMILVEKALADAIGQKKIVEMKMRKTLPLIVVIETDVPSLRGF